MNLRVVVHEAEEGGYWAEVPAVPGCVTQADTLDELRKNIHEAIQGCLSVEMRGTSALTCLGVMGRF